MSSHDKRPQGAPTPERSNMLLARRIEEASLNAWPALQQIFLDGWILRFSRGFTKRSNSIVPLYPPVQTPQCQPRHSNRQPLVEKIRYCENLYAREQLQTVFRLTSINIDSGSYTSPTPVAATLDSVLAQRGYTLNETSLVLSKTLIAENPHPRLQILSLDRWLSVYCELTGMPEPARSLHGLILKSISGECGFGALFINGQPVACGLAVLEREFVGLFDIFTHPDTRRSGHGTDMVNGLLAWASAHGATRAYLQMVQDNNTAATLYENLGFREIYRYWYRIST